jgi:CheY-like chemotaxis protein
MNSQPGLPIEVLLVEDSLGDIRLTQEAFREASDVIRLHVALDGVEAMQFLRREGPHAHAPRPDLILLDLNLPRMDGREVLALVKSDDDLMTIPTSYSPHLKPRRISRKAISCRPTAT